jgi:hypothetical protein
MHASMRACIRLNFEPHHEASIRHLVLQPLVYCLLLYIDGVEFVIRVVLSASSFICADMTSWFSRATESRNAQLITTAVVSGAVVASTILGFQQARRMYRVADLKASIPDIDDEHHAQRVSVATNMDCNV